MNIKFICDYSIAESMCMVGVGSILVHSFRLLKIALSSNTQSLYENPLSKYLSILIVVKILLIIHSIEIRKSFLN